MKKKRFIAKALALHKKEATFAYITYFQLQTMARKLLLFHLLSFCCLLSANGQIPDLVIIGKDTLMLLECPIEHDSILSRRVSERLSREGGCTGLLEELSSSVANRRR